MFKNKYIWKMKEIIITINRKAKFNYNLLLSYTAGIQLQGSEVKSIKQNQVSLKESYCFIEIKKYG